MFYVLSYLLLAVVGFFIVGPAIKMCWVQHARAAVPFIVVTFIALGLLPLCI